MQPPANLVAVARRAKVSISTVSRTINQTGKISVKTQERVRRVMRELGYQPNRVARRLRQRDCWRAHGRRLPPWATMIRRSMLGAARA